MSHVIVPNYRPIAITEGFQPMWQLTRAMLAAGWKYRASGDATGAAKEVSGITGQTETAFYQDRWGLGGGVNLSQVGSQTGTNPTIGTPSNGVSTITGLSGMSSSLSPGRFLKFSGAVNSNNNGTFRIVAFVSATSVTIWNPGAVSESGANITWTEQQGGNTLNIAVAGGGGAAPNRAILTGLTGMAQPTTSPVSRGCVGDRIFIAGAATGANNGCFLITRWISASSVEIENPSAVADANNGSITWSEYSPTAQSYPPSLQGATGSGAWINLQGPSMMKIPIGTNNTTGNFIRGENVTQTTSGAQGAIIGVIVDTAGGTGFLVIEPRVNGTGSGARGWTSGVTDTITGAQSGATVTSSTSVPIEFVREMVVWKNTVSAGHIYLQCVDQSSESASRFSQIANTAGTTATICPGGATGAFPTPGSWVMLGTGASNAASTGSTNWYQFSGTNSFGNFHIMCANCIAGSGVSADGSWTILASWPPTSSSSYSGQAYLRLDDSEDGDVDPYVSFTSSGLGVYPMTGSTRTNNTTVNSQGSNTDIFNLVNVYVNGLNHSPYFGFRRRGFATGDAYQQYGGCELGSPAASSYNYVNANPSGPDREANTLVANVYAKEPVWVISTQVNQKQRKGTVRWWYYVQGGAANTTLSNGQFMQVSAGTGGGLLMGPWDGQTIPTNN